MAVMMSRTQSHEELVVNHAHLCKRHERLEGSHEGLVTWQWQLDDRCDTIDADIEGQIHRILRVTLLSFIQRMD